MKKKNIAVLTGGFSGEAKVSRKGAKVVEKYMDRKLYNVYKIHIYKNRWYHETDDGNEIEINKDDFSLNLDGKKIKFDCIFNVIHGTPGEDGKLQGYFDMLGIPYTNSNQTASSITFNKYLTGILASSYGVKVPKTILLKRQQSTDHSPLKISQKSKVKSQKTHSLILSQERNILELGMPLIVKPNNGGSSIGMSKVEKKEMMEEALDKAFRADNEVLIQEFIKGTEITCGMIRKKGEIISLPLTEVVPKNNFFDFEAKYSKGKSEEITPARVSKEIEKECKKISAMIYENLNCKGMVRMDYIVKVQSSKFKVQSSKQKFELFLLDINTVPGLSEASIVPKQATVAGMSLTELYNIVIEEALRIEN